ncbi:MAG TPA: hypothetical protein HPP83_01840 [Candidatus Hydrogenedentes bacterium]|nr:hypothetical protein [Candidatus Hydrogenedentota bacterium]
MDATSSEPALPLVWTVLGIAGGLIFYGRFYVQWIASERKKKSVMPIAFWYMSCAGVLLLFPYAVRTRSPIGALGLCFNLIVYARNLVHIWRKKQPLPAALVGGLHVLLASVTLVALGLVVFTWRAEYEVTRQATTAQAADTWFWLGVGLTGQVLFALRFLVQWIVTERKKMSVVPTAFWYLSAVAASLQLGCFAQRQEWVFAAGMAATIFIYVRNLWFIYRKQDAACVPGDPSERQTS